MKIRIVWIQRPWTNQEGWTTTSQEAGVELRGRSARWWGLLCVHVGEDGWILRPGSMALVGMRERNWVDSRPSPWRGLGVGSSEVFGPVGEESGCLPSTISNWCVENWREEGSRKKLDLAEPLTTRGGWRQRWRMGVSRWERASMLRHSIRQGNVAARARKSNVMGELPLRWPWIKRLP